MIMNITPQNGDRKLIKYKKGDVKKKKRIFKVM